MKPVAIVGGGSWGTALAVHLAARRDVRLYVRDEDDPQDIARRRESRVFLPGITIPERVTVTSDLDAVLDGADLATIAVPTQFLRGFLAAHRDAPWPEGPLALAGKGIEVGTLSFPGTILAEVMGPAAAAREVVLSGPSFAREVAIGEPTAIVAAGLDAAHARHVQATFSHDNLRVYTAPDPVGVQVAAALKNVVAIAAGVADGLGYGSNTVAALITRALAEISRLGVKLGARRETFMGLAGLGDLVLTCTGGLSRNRQVGQHLGRGRTLDEILGEMKMVAEGVQTSRAARALGAREGVPMPIVEQVHAILFDGKDPRRALSELLARPLRGEHDDDPAAADGGRGGAETAHP